MYDWTDDFFDQIRFSYPKYNNAYKNNVDDYIGVENIMDDIMNSESARGNA